MRRKSVPAQRHHACKLCLSLRTQRQLRCVRKHCDCCKQRDLLQSASKSTESEGEKNKEGPDVKSILFKDVLPNPYVWLFALSYFFVYLVRQGASTWFVHYLMNVKGLESLSSAAAQVSGLEVGGFFGALSAGALPVEISHTSWSRALIEWHARLIPMLIAIANQAVPPRATYALRTSSCQPPWFAVLQLLACRVCSRIMALLRP